MKDFSLGAKFDGSLNAMKKARYYLMLIKPDERVVGVSSAIGILGAAIAHMETHDEAAYVSQICAEEPWPPTFPKEVKTNAT